MSKRNKRAARFGGDPFDLPDYYWPDLPRWVSQKRVVRTDRGFRTQTRYIVASPGEVLSTLPWIGSR